jgi:L-2-hydroxycarboxylate dehydrogenase (NAD+)
VVMDPARGSGVVARLSGYLDMIRQSAPANPAQTVLVPGDRAQIARARRLADGIPVEPRLWSMIRALSNPQVQAVSS